MAGLGLGICPGNDYEYGRYEELRSILSEQVRGIMKQLLEARSVLSEEPPSTTTVLLLLQSDK